MHLWICGSSGWSCTNLSRASTWRLSSVSYRGLSWWTRRDLHPRGPVCKAGAYLTQPHAHLAHGAGFEPASPGSEPGLLAVTAPVNVGGSGRIRTCRARKARSISSRTASPLAALPVWFASPFGGRRGIRTHDPGQGSCFRNRCVQPLRHSSISGTGADDGTRTRSPPVDSRVFSLRTPSASGQLGRT